MIGGLHSTVDSYLTQWLQTATKGNVTFCRSLFEDRYQFGCRVCEATLTIPGSGVDVNIGIDYKLQQFVQSHVHAYYPRAKYTPLDWEDHQGMNPLPSTTGGTSYTHTYCQPGAAAPEPTPVTMDFKKVKPKNLKLSTGRKFR